VYELHDGLLQWVISAKMNLELAAAERAEPAQEPDYIQQAHQFLEEAIQEGRRLITFLEESPEPEAVSIEEHLVRFVELQHFNAKLAGQRLEFELESAECPAFPAAIAWNILRVIEQAIANAIRHAGPCRIRAHCREQSGAFQMIVEDDGQGFDIASARESSDRFGLPGMEHRAKLIGGELSIRSKKGQGTTVALAVPLHLASR
jgi:signal transduction histidine kinase